MCGATIREFFRQLLGSRLVSTLELQLLQLRQDFDERIQDKENTIASLKETLAVLEAKVTRYEAKVFARESTLGAELVAQDKPKKPSFLEEDWTNLSKIETPWQRVQREHEEQIAADIEAEKSQAKAAEAPQGTA